MEIREEYYTHARQQWQAAQARAWGDLSPLRRLQQQMRAKRLQQLLQAGRDRPRQPEPNEEKRQRFWQLAQQAKEFCAKQELDLFAGQDQQGLGGTIQMRGEALGLSRPGHSGQLEQLQALLGAADDVWLGLEGETFCLELLFDFCLEMPQAPLLQKAPAPQQSVMQRPTPQKVDLRRTPQPLDLQQIVPQQQEPCQPTICQKRTKDQDSAL